MTQHRSEWRRGRAVTAEAMTCADFVKSVLSRTASVFDRLLYLASLEDPATGRYGEELMEQMFGDQDVDRALREQHVAIFQNWLCLTLPEQTADLEWYLANRCQDRRATLRQWVREKSYERLIPRGAGPSERQLFLTDLEVVLPLLYAKAT